MPEYCTSKNKATVTFLINKGTERVVSSICPVVVECSPFSAIITVLGDGEDGNKHVPNVRASETVEGGSLEDKYSLRLVECTVEIGCSSNSPNTQTKEKYYQAQLLRNGIYTGKHYGHIGWYSAAIESVVNNNINFKIANSSGVLFEKTYPQCPSFEVSCDEDCPPGHIRCDSAGYPGYCCIPCAELAQRVNAMTRRLR